MDMWDSILKLIDKMSCKHDWKEIKEILVRDDFGGFYHKYLFVCKKCGKFKWIKSR